MALPNVEYVTVTARYLYADGTPAEGSVTFTTPRELIDAVEQTVVLQASVTVDLDANGELTTELATTDELDPEGWQYSVRERVGSTTTSYALSVPTGSAIDLSLVDRGTVAPVPAERYATQAALASGVAEAKAYADTLSTEGVPGPKGDDGDSAYEVAVDNGFVGSESEWLTSLQGPAGVDGAQGPEGPQGETGPAGVVAATSPVVYDAGTQTISAPTALEKDVTLGPNDQALIIRADSEQVADVMEFRTHDGAKSTYFNEYGEVRVVPGRTSTVPVRIKQKGPGQTGNLLEVTEADNTVLNGFAPDGSLINPPSYDEIPDAPVRVIVSSTAPADTTAVWIDTSGL